ncbi:hypothetical protein ACFFJY_00510 [Fictibacillus aquaticus]|uniref:YhfM-like domain-containing protein n=1 Tax=Fictibacillus aquaticus TaxID=2021314 RepID=A0A235F7M9_9BACL|nr:hypothetical protein [Fictibacillus aquaticus]OYD57209.1 hypothetical protein CGZ90_10990 [Fictibacillus aquaticus]
MRKFILLLSLSLFSAFLFGCQSEDSTAAGVVKAHGGELQPPKEITKIIISKSKGASPTIFKEDKDIQTFQSVISSAVKENGIVNMANPEFYFDVIYTDDNKQSYHLWLGEKGQQSTLMKTDDTHSIYTVSEKMTNKLIEIIE